MFDDAELADSVTRDEIYASLHPRPTDADGRLLRQLLPIECVYRVYDSSPTHDDYFENLFWCALLLYQLADLGDVLPMWRAKHTDFDTGCSFDIQFLVGAGVDATIEYLTQNNDPDASDAVDYIRVCKEAGDFDYLDDWLNFRIDYFGKSA